VCEEQVGEDRVRVLSESRLIRVKIA
jgi:hypothetical protein